MQNNKKRNILSGNPILGKVLFVLSLLSIFCIVLSIGKFISPPWELKITTENVLCEKITDDTGAIVDKSGDRLSFLDSNKNVCEIKTSYKTDNNLYHYNYADFNSNNVFSTEYCYYENSSFLKQEKIVQYSKNGTDAVDLVTFNYDLDQNYTNTTNIKSLFATDNKLYFTCYNAKNNTYSINSISLESAGYELKSPNQETDLMNAFPNPCNIMDVYTIEYDASNNQLIVVDCFGNSYIAHSGDSCFSNYKNNFINQYNTEGVSAANATINSIFSEKTLNSGETYDYNLSTIVRIVSFWLSIAYFIVLFTVAAIMLIKRLSIKTSKKEFIHKIKVPAIITISTIIAICIVFFTSSNNFQNEINNQKTILSQNVLLFKNLGTTKLIDLCKANETTDEYKNCWQKISKELEYSALMSARSGANANYAIYKFTNNNYQLLINSVYPSLSGMYDDKAFSYEPNQNSFGMTEGEYSNLSGTYRYAACNIYDNSNNIIGSVVCYCDNSTDIFVLKSNTILIILGIISALVTLSLVVLDVAAWIRSLSWRKKLKSNKEVKEYSLTIPLYFLNTASSSADATIGVIIFKNILSGTGFQGNMLMVALPLTCKAIGNILGAVFFSWIFNRLSTKTILLISAIGAFISYVICGFMIYASNILALSLVLIIANFFNKLIWTYLKQASYNINDPEKGKMVRNRCTASGISGLCLITLIVGYTTDIFGDWSIYICAAVPALLIFIIVLFLLPKKTVIKVTKKLSKSEKKAHSKDIYKFLSRGNIITIIFSAFLIGILISGYKTFIFPLLADMNGFSKSDVGNISVFSNAIAFYFMPLFIIRKKNKGFLDVLLSTELIVALIFLMLAFNNSFIWACCVYFIAQILNNYISSCSTDYWRDVASATNTDPNIAMESTSVANEVLELFKPCIIGALMIVGPVFTCVIIGVYSIISGVTFKVFDKKYKQKQDKT